MNWLNRESMNLLKFNLLIIFLISLPAVLSHHPTEQLVENPAHLKEQAARFIAIVTVLITIITAVALIIKKRKINGPVKITLFLSIAIPVLAATFYLLGTTIYINHVAATNGPVHWHADIEVWNCGKKLNLLAPVGLSNRIGTPLLHEHGDDRIHIEGVVHDLQDASLPSFFAAVGGTLSSRQLLFLTDEEVVSVSQGGQCEGLPGEIQVFVYSTKQDADSIGQDYRGQERFSQRKLSDFNDYLLSPYSAVPPGDCIIVEFAPSKEKTDKICESYRLAELNVDITSKNKNSINSDILHMIDDENGDLNGR